MMKINRSIAEAKKIHAARPEWKKHLLQSMVDECRAAAPEVQHNKLLAMHKEQTTPKYKRVKK